MRAPRKVETMAAKKAAKKTTKKTTKVPVSLASKKTNGKHGKGDLLWFGKLCAQKREVGGWTQTEVGKAVGCRNGWLSAIETGKHAPSPPLAHELLRFLKFTKIEKQEVFARLPQLKGK